MNKSTLVWFVIIIIVIIGGAIIMSQPIEVAPISAPESTSTPATSTPTTSASSPIIPTPAPAPLISVGEAVVIAQGTQECSTVGVLSDKTSYNPNSKTWWIDLNRTPELEKDGCNPACVVSGETKTAEVNWRCTGAILPAPGSAN